MRFFEYNIFGIYKTTFVLQFRLYIRQKDINIIFIDSSLPIKRIISNIAFKN